MGSIVELVNSTPLFGGLSGYRRSQLGQPNSSVGQPPQFRGEVSKPAADIKAPPILSSAARHNRGTNVTIPFPRVVIANELTNKGRLSPGDVAFIAKNQMGVTSHVRLNQQQQYQVTSSVSVPHASLSRLVGVDYINRGLGPANYAPGRTVLVDSINPLDDWRGLTFLQEYTIDGVVMSDDNPHYVMSSSEGNRNDQIFNMAIQGPVQLNNGYVDDNGRGVRAHYDFTAQKSAGSLALSKPEGMSRQDFIKSATPDSKRIAQMIAGPAYDQYPLQMFDRKITPLSDLFVGLVCRKITGAELNEVNEQRKSTSSDPGPFGGAVHIHVFQYVCFSSRQIYQFARKGGKPDEDMVDAYMEPGEHSGATAEPASRRRGPLDHKRKRNETHLPRKRDASTYEDSDNFLGINKNEVRNMVGAWRLGKVLDVASKRQESYMGGPVDTSFAVTLNLDVGFMDWRALRRYFSMGLVGQKLNVGGFGWDTFEARTGKFVQDYGRVMHWPTKYTIDWKKNQSATDASKIESNIPINPVITKADNRGSELYFQTEYEAGAQIQQYKDEIDNANNAVAFPSIASANGSIMAPVPGATNVQGARVASQPSPANMRPAATQSIAAAQPPVASSGEALSISNIVAQDTPTAPPEAVSEPSPSVCASAPASAPPAKPTSAASRQVTSMGDDVMASIFGSSTSAAAASTPPAPAEPPPPKATAKFPRRTRDR